MLFFYIISRAIRTKQTSHTHTHTHAHTRTRAHTRARTDMGTGLRVLTILNLQAAPLTPTLQVLFRGAVGARSVPQRSAAEGEERESGPDQPDQTRPLLLYTYVYIYIYIHTYIYMYR